MLTKLTYVQKNQLILPAFGLGLLLCWFLAFNKTFDAIQINGKLKSDFATENDISFNPIYAERKLTALNKILKGYKTSEQWNDELWMQASAIAIKYGVAVDFTLNKPISGEVDSTAVGQTQSLYFYGRFVQLVKLIDTLEGLPRIGKIAALKVKAPKGDASGERDEKCMLRVDFKGFNHLTNK